MERVVSKLDAVLLRGAALENRKQRTDPKNMSHQQNVI